uniref:NADH-ubiquinone oxidoreductase chain 6 n=1 Tax=Priolepis semidoliata TaxID=1156130 RepID=A0A5K7TNB8_9GOBI|nr:NADH dehydrogenase subunit 6 [Priolepis semidoliata]BBH37199.1 NADH dehydrogenase subunit 6 [Priolepis semidoliata]BBH37212.1 NADH dehydrogenase subunit 6 [Priolepis semidoliata]BBH37225.1 NADH dehydrogenase subunit 6 [Priolepis semidoliata]
MLSVMYMLMSSMLVGVFVVISNSSPYFAALGLVVFAGMGCGLMMACGGTFLALILFLIYLGGMLVVFAYTSALASDPYPEAWENPNFGAGALVYAVGVFGGAGIFWAAWFLGGGFWGGMGDIEVSIMGEEGYGVAALYEGGGGALVVTAWVMLIMLFVVLELTRGGSRGTLRGV